MKFTAVFFYAKVLLQRKSLDLKEKMEVIGFVIASIFNEIAGQLGTLNLTIKKRAYQETDIGPTLFTTINKFSKEVYEEESFRQMEIGIKYLSSDVEDITADGLTVIEQIDSLIKERLKVNELPMQIKSPKWEYDGKTFNYSFLVFWTEQDTTTNYDKMNQFRMEGI